jgi:hypothetical protein
MIVSLQKRKLESLQRWRRQIGCRMHHLPRQGPRPHALLSYRLHVEPENGFVPLSRMTFFVLFDEWQFNSQEERRLVTRFLGFSAICIGGGIRIGGPQLCRLDKDLRRAPVVGGRGSRLNALDGGLLETALACERSLERYARHPHFPRRHSPKIPSLWSSTNESSADDDGFRLLAPLDQAIRSSVSAENVLVDVRSIPKRQVIGITNPNRDLRGQVGCVEFDFYGSRFSSIA